MFYLFRINGKEVLIDAQLYGSSALVRMACEKLRDK